MDRAGREKIQAAIPKQYHQAILPNLSSGEFEDEDNVRYVNIVTQRKRSTDGLVPSSLILNLLQKADLLYDDHAEAAEPGPRLRFIEELSVNNESLTFEDMSTPPETTP